MSKTSFVVYIDESGDEGFRFRDGGKGSSEWFVLGAAVTRREDDRELVHLLAGVRDTLGLRPKEPVHFRTLRHERRLPYVRAIANAPLWVLTVLVHKPSLDPGLFQAEKHTLYRHTSRLLLERVSWLCRNEKPTEPADGRAEVIFSNRAQMSYAVLREDLAQLKASSKEDKAGIDWSVIDTEDSGCLRAIEHSQRAGLQIADAVASSFWYAVNPNRFGDVEPRYAASVVPRLFRDSNGTVHGHGFTCWPRSLKAESPHLAGFEELLGAGK